MMCDKKNQDFIRQFCYCEQTKSMVFKNSSNIFFRFVQMYCLFYSLIINLKMLSIV